MTSVRALRARFEGMRPVVRGVALLLHVPALMSLVGLPICLVYGEADGFRVMATTGLVSLAVAQLLYWPSRAGTQLYRRHAMLIAAISWLLISAFGALPFMLGHDASLVDAGFESLSGFTGTGLSVLTPSRLPHYLQWWRSLTQWIGGVGVIVLLLSILPPRRGALELYYSETRDQKILPSVRSTARAIWSIYCVYTVLGIGLLWLGGEPLWRAINHGMTAIATGGLTITDDSLKSTPALTKLAYLPILIAGAIGFFTHYQAVQSRRPLRALFTGSEQTLFWSVLVLGATLLAADNGWLGQSNTVDSVVQWVSAATTGGFQSAPLADWHPGTLVLLCLVMLVGTMAGSTGGGLKMERVVLLYKSMRWSLAALTRRPHEVLRLTYDGVALVKADAAARMRAVTTLTIGWVCVSLLAIIALSHCVPADTPLQSIVFEVTSAQSNVGLSTGLADASLSTPGKLTLMVVMWAGRLEIVPVLVLIALTLRGHGPGTKG